MNKQVEEKIILDEITFYLNKLKSHKKLGQFLYEFFSINMDNGKCNYDLYLLKLLLNNQPCYEKYDIGYINYLNTYLKILNKKRLNIMFLNYVKHIVLNIHKNLDTHIKK